MAKDNYIGSLFRPCLHYRDGRREPPWLLTKLDNGEVYLNQVGTMRHDRLPERLLWNFYDIVACPECAREVTIADLDKDVCPGCGIA